MSRCPCRARGWPRSASLVLGIAVAAAACAGVPRSTVTPGVELVGLDVRTGADGQRFALTLLVSNSNAVPIPVAEIRYSVRVAGEGYLNGRFATPVVLAAAARQTVRVELAADSVSSASRLLALAQGPDNALDYELTGEFVLSGRPPRTLRFAHRDSVPLTIAPSR